MIAARVRVGLVGIAVASGVMAGVWLEAPGAPAEPRPLVGPCAVPDEQITRALYAQSRDLDGCFAEWAERSQHGDTRMVVTLIITDDGVAHSVVARFPTCRRPTWSRPACCRRASRPRSGGWSSRRSDVTSTRP